MEGHSLVPELYGAEAAPRDVVLDLPRTTNSDRRRALIRGDYKLIAIGDDDAFQLFNLRRDPGEEHDVRWTEPAKLEEMKAAYAALSAKMPSVCPNSRLKLRGKKSHRPC
jgi:arylsulfatase A-like enzyme